MNLYMDHAHVVDTIKKIGPGDTKNNFISRL